MANVRTSYVFGVKRLKPWRKHGTPLYTLRDVLDEPQPAPKRRMSTLFHPPVNAPARDLARWKRLHETPTFNPGPVVITEDTLNANPPPDLKPLLPRAHPEPYLCQRNRSLPLYFVYKTMEVYEAHKLPQPFADEEAILAGIRSIDSASPDFFVWSDDGYGSERPKFCASPCIPTRSLLRRPLVRHHSRQELLPRVQGEDKMSVFRRFSLTTLDDRSIQTQSGDRPFRSRSFYKHSYPIVLKCIPKRTDAPGEGAGTAYLYHVMPVRQISFSVFSDFNLSSPSLDSSDQLIRAQAASMHTRLTVPDLVGSVYSTMDNRDLSSFPKD